MNKVVLTAPFSPVLTVEEVRRKIMGDTTMALSRRQSAFSLLGCAARLLGTPPGLLPFDNTLLQKLSKVAPRRHRIGKGHLQNIRGAVRIGLEHQGIELVRGRDLSPPSACWKALLDQLVDK